jgi:hypothetical protein
LKRLPSCAARRQAKSKSRTLSDHRARQCFFCMHRSWHARCQLAAAGMPDPKAGGEGLAGQARCGMRKKRLMAGVHEQLVPGRRRPGTAQTGRLL